MGYSLLDPLARWTGGPKPTACPVVFDVHTERCELADVRAFVDRIGRATRRADAKLPCLGVIASRDFTPEAWSEARKYRLATVNFRQLFGQAALEAVAESERLLAAADPTKADTGYLAGLLDDLKGNPVVVQIRSIAFEVVAALALQSDGWEQVGLGLDVPWKPPDSGETTRDVDVYGLKGDDTRLVECKAYHADKEVTPEEVKKFFTETVPAFVKWQTARGDRSTKYRAELWTTGRFGDGAVEALEGLSLGAHVDPALCNAADIRAMLPRKLKQRCNDLLREIGRRYDAAASGRSGRVAPERPADEHAGFQSKSHERGTTSINV